MMLPAAIQETRQRPYVYVAAPEHSVLQHSVSSAVKPINLDCFIDTTHAKVLIDSIMAMGSVVPTTPTMFTPSFTGSEKKVSPVKNTSDTVQPTNEPRNSVKVAAPLAVKETKELSPLKERLLSNLQKSFNDRQGQDRYSSISSSVGTLIEAVESMTLVDCRKDSPTKGEDTTIVVPSGYHEFIFDTSRIKPLTVNVAPSIGKLTRWLSRGKFGTWQENFGYVATPESIKLASEAKAKAKHHSKSSRESSSNVSNTLLNMIAERAKLRAANDHVDEVIDKANNYVVADNNVDLTASPAPWGDDDSTELIGEEQRSAPSVQEIEALEKHCIETILPEQSGQITDAVLALGYAVQERRARRATRIIEIAHNEARKENVHRIGWEQELLNENIMNPNWVINNTHEEALKENANYTGGRATWKRKFKDFVFDYSVEDISTEDLQEYLKAMLKKPLLESREMSTFITEKCTQLDDRLSMDAWFDKKSLSAYGTTYGSLLAPTELAFKLKDYSIQKARHNWLNKTVSPTAPPYELKGLYDPIPSTVEIDRKKMRGDTSGTIFITDLAKTPEEKAAVASLSSTRLRDIVLDSRTAVSSYSGKLGLSASRVSDENTEEMISKFDFTGLIAIPK